MSEEKFRLPKSSYEELKKIIIAYGFEEKPQSLDEIAKSTGIFKTNISQNNAFLMSIGIIEGGKEKKPTPEGKNLATALNYDNQTGISSSWKRIIANSDFIKKMLQALIVRKGMDEEYFKNHIAYSSGEPKKSRTLTGSKTIIDILEHSKLIKFDGKVYIPSTNIDNFLYYEKPPLEIETEQKEAEEKDNKKILQNLSEIKKSIEKEIFIFNINITIPTDLENLENTINQVREIVKKNSLE